MAFHNDLALDEALDALDPLRHLMHEQDSSSSHSSTSSRSPSPSPSHHAKTTALPLLPKQRRTVHNETLHLEFAHTSTGAEAEQRPPIAITLVVDAGPGCGGIAWPAGEVLARYLVQRGAAYVRGRTILELGSGTGLVGLVAAKLAHSDASAGDGHVWITDQAPLLDIMRRNTRENALEEQVSVAEFNWGTPLPVDIPVPDLVLAADCVYFEPAFPLLVQTLAALVDAREDRGSRGETEVLFCYKKRRKADKKFFSLLRKSFTWTEVRCAE
ncbi:hypothetical protein H0H81_007719 [Sphagnurus paluster]|uniref:Protein-lysine N-methyltransferase EFM6 n=1 Tax=Sphagnurus paluster TaxID=117069 RepID=A0A9P7GJD1_9AGAR|nr:hypothetical protein H0H81_007719 [Sphagnurus paluster]